MPRDTPITVRLDDYPDPDTVGTAGFIVTTGVFYHGGFYDIDLIEKTIAMRPSGGLRAALGYDATIRPALLSLRGCPAATDRRSFRSASAPPPAPPPPPTAVPFSEVRPIIARSCGGATCHRAETRNDDADATTDALDAADGCLATPAVGLSLCDRDAVAALVDVPSRQVSRLNLVARNDSTRSYLLRKLLPGDTPDRPAPTALGHRDPPGAPLSRDELHAIARWIDTGANP